MKTDLIGKIVIVDRIKNGNWIGYFEGTVIDVKDNKAKVSTWQNGDRWYSLDNVKLKN